MPIEIFRVHADQIRRAAAAAHPNECCGLLLGIEDRILGIVASPNVAANPSCRFEVDPAITLATHRRAREGGLQLLGCYHSHPSAALAPSALDAARASVDLPLWLLVSADDLAAWRWTQNGSFTEMDLMLVG